MTEGPTSSANRATVSRHHRRQKAGTEVDHRGDVYLDLVEFGGRIGGLLRPHRGQAGVVYQHVDFQPEFGDPARQFGAVPANRKISRQNRTLCAQLRSEFGQPVGPAGHQDHMPSAPGEFTGELGADSRRCPGNQRSLLHEWIVT